jgi:peptide/nickel transport system substrate-binding protein
VTSTQDELKVTRVRISRRDFLRYSFLGSSAAILGACAPVVVQQQPGGADTSDAASQDAGTSAEVASEEMAEPAAEEPSGTMVWMGHQEVSGLGPDDMGPTVHVVMIYNIHNPLVLYNEFTELEMVLAESVDVAEDGLTYTFKLREGVLFHDGKEFTSADVKYTYDYYRNPDNASTIQGDFLGIDTIETPDDYTVVLNMAEVNAASLSNWAQTPIVQSEYHAEVGEEVYRTAPIGTGAFKLKDWNAAEFTELEAFADHFRGQSKIAIIRQDVVPEPSVRMLALQTGDAHSATWPLLVEDSIELESDSENFVVYRTLANSVKHFPLNTSLPQLAEKQVRQAMMHALDRQRIIDDLWDGAAQVAHSNLAPKNAFYYKSDTKQYEYDLEKAKAMLDEAGWVEGSDGIREKDGVKLAFTCTTITGDQARRPIAELAQQMLAQVGVDMQLAEAPVASILEGMTNGTMDASLFNWTYGSTPEPDPFATLHSTGGNNFCQFKNDTMDDLIERGVALVDPEERRAIYHQIQDLFVEEVPALYLQFDEWMNVFSTQVQGLPEDVLSGDPIYYQAYKYTLNG